MGYLADTCSESKKDGRRGLYCMKATKNNRFGDYRMLPIEKIFSTTGESSINGYLNSVLSYIFCSVEHRGY